jgi:hypothetical protein
MYFSLQLFSVLFSEFERCIFFFGKQSKQEEESKREMGEGEEISACTIASPTSYCKGRIVYPTCFSKPAAPASPSNANLQQQGELHSVYVIYISIYYATLFNLPIVNRLDVNRNS